MYHKKVITIILLFVAVMLFSTVHLVRAQATAGDGAFIAYNVDGDDDLAFVVFRGILPGSTIFFTDDEWNGTQFVDANEGTLQWTNDTGLTIAAGTVLSFTDVDSAANPLFGVNIGSLTVSEAGFDMAAAGDIVYAYMGTRLAPEFMGAFTSRSNGWVDNGGTLVGTGLTEGTTAINYSDLEGLLGTPDGARYDGARTGLTNMSDYLALLNTAANITFNSADGEALLPFDDTPFTGNPTSITLSTFTGGSTHNTQAAYLAGGTVLLLTMSGLIILRRNKKA